MERSAPLPITDLASAGAVARDYRVALDYDGHLIHARCVELPELSASNIDLQRVLDSLMHQVSLRLLAHASTNAPIPAPLRHAEGPLGAWTEDLELVTPIDEGTHPADIDEMQIPVLCNIAHGIARRYRVVLEQTGPEQFRAESPEVPGSLGLAATAPAAVDSLRHQLTQYSLALLLHGLTPPEPAQDREGGIPRRMVA